MEILDWDIYGLNGWDIYGLNGWGIYGLNGWGKVSYCFFGGNVLKNAGLQGNTLSSHRI